MEPFEILLTAVLFSAAALLPALFRALLFLVARVDVVSGASRVAALDRHLAETGWCTARLLGTARLPADGVHFLTDTLLGLVVAHRRTENLSRGGTETRWTLYTLRSGGSRSCETLRAKLLGDPRDVSVRFVFAPVPWRTSTTTLRLPPPSAAYAWQAAAVEKLLEAYRRDGRVSALICGPRGTGKTTVGELLAAALSRETRVAPEVVRGFDLAAPGLLPEDAFDTPTESSPVVLMLDELDAAIDHAESGPAERKGEGSALADTPTSLLGALDFLGKIPYLVVIATSNRSLPEMAAGPSYARYTRPGRLDHHFEGASCAL